MNPLLLQSSISNLEDSKQKTEQDIKNIKIVEPKEFYHEDKHDNVKEVIKSRFAELVTCENKVEEIQDLIEKYGDGIFVYSPWNIIIGESLWYSWFFDGMFASGAVWAINAIVEWFEVNRPKSE